MNHTDQMSVRTTFDNNGDADSYEIEYNTYRLLAFAYNDNASTIQIWNKDKNCITRTVIYRPIHTLTNTTLKSIMIASIAQNELY